MTIFKVKTSGVTHFLVDTENHKLMRVRGEGSQEFWHDHRWMRYMDTIQPKVGEPMFIYFTRMSEGWHRTSLVTSVETVTKDEANSFITERVSESQLEYALLP